MKSFSIKDLRAVSYVCDLMGVPDVDRCNMLVDHGLRIRVHQWHKSNEEYIWDEKVERRFPLHTVTAKRSKVRNMFALIRECFRDKSDVYIVYGYQKPRFLFLSVILKLFGHAVLSINDSKFDDYERSIFSDLIKLIFLLPYDGFFSATDRSASYLRYLGKRNIQTYYCAIDTKRIANGVKEHSFNCSFSDRDFVMIARFLPKKNYSTLLSAYEIYSGLTAVPRRLIICGYGPLEADIRKQVGQSALLSRLVTINGYTTVEQTYEILAHAAALILPSYEEQFGIVVIEALAAQVPVIVSPCCGAADLVDNNVNGFKIEPFNKKGLAHALQLLTEDEALWERMRAAAPVYAARADVTVFRDALLHLTNHETYSSDEAAPEAPISTKKEPDRGIVRDKSHRKNIAVIYHFFPHYRRAILHELTASQSYNFEFWGSHSKFDNIEPFVGDAKVAINPLFTRLAGKRFHIHGFWKPVLDRRIEGLIILGNPNIFETWMAALAGRLLGKKVLFWTHGWRRREPVFKTFVRRMYLRLANLVLVYGERAIDLGREAGFPADRIVVIYNSLDWAEALILCKAYEKIPWEDLRLRFTSTPNLPLIVCTARLNSDCQFDILMLALARLQELGRKVSLVLLGEGPERGQLENLAKVCGLSVQFLGAVYDENVTGALLYAADLTVSPGKIGLTAIHSLMYGTPIITHDDWDNQFPEVEALIPGVTGAFFRRNDVDDLVRVIDEWLSTKRDRQSLRKACQLVIREKFNPNTQRVLIERALNRLFTV
jgi:glycosyltransferase involved in cell wall biosynthesis